MLLHPCSPYALVGGRDKAHLWPQITAAPDDANCGRAALCGARNCARRGLSWRELESRLSAGAGARPRVGGSPLIWKDDQALLGNSSEKVTRSGLGEKFKCWSHEGDPGEPAPTEWTALAPLEQAILFLEKEETRLFLCGPQVGDLAEVEAFCRLYRLAEQLHTTVMNALRSCSDNQNLDGKTPGPDGGDVSLEEEKVASGLAHLMALLHDGKSEVLGVGSNSRTKLIEEESIDDRPPFTRFRKEVRDCCRTLEEALGFLLPADSQQMLDTQRKMLKLKNACLDAGFPRPEGFPSHADIPNLAPVRLRPSKSARTLYKDEDVAFWRGGHITECGLEWLVGKGFKVIVDLREGSAQPIAQSPLPDAVASGKVKVVRMPVERGSAPSKEQVEDFARLVAEAGNRPLYLHTRAGVGRASAMVSRWRELVLRERLHAGRATKDSLNGTPLSEFELSSFDDVVRISQEDALALESENGHPSASLSSQLDAVVALPFDLERTATSEVDVVECADVPEPVEREVLMPATANGSIDHHVSFVIIENPLEAQRPVPNVLSRRAMSKFMKRRKVPASFFTGRRDRAVSTASSAPTHELENGNIAGPANRWGLASPGIPRANAPEPSRREVIQEEQNQQLDGSPSNGSYAGKAAKRNGHARTELVEGNAGSRGDDFDRDEKQEKGEFNNSLESPTIEVDAPFFRVPGEHRSVDEGEEPVSVEGNMCASTTGVVRLQSRKKAEMFLVRTDGYSCTRERVKESTLAFTHPSTQQQMLMWKTAPRTVLLLKKLGDELMKATQEVASFLHHQEGMNVVVEPEVHDQLARLPGFGFVQTFYNQDTSELHERVDFVVCLGGDGVILHTSNLFRNAVPPVVSFNLGSLGFLTSHAFKDYVHDLQAVIHGHNDMMTGVYITLRMRLRCELYRNGKPIPGKVFDVLNEVVVDRGSNPYLCKIECYERNRLITKVQADGVIVATPTGSTAYSTAAGGSMVHPNVPCMLFTPICPHSLSFRPVILPDSALLELKVPRDARNNAWVSFDGKKRQQLSKGESVRICMSEHPLPTVNKSDQTDDWFQSLVRCLNWNERLEQRPLSVS